MPFVSTKTALLASICFGSLAIGALLLSVPGCSEHEPQLLTPKALAAEPKAEDASGRPLSHPFPRRVIAPPLSGGLGWLNTDGPLTLQDLRGKFVLLDFWTYCCINCMHVLPELKQLEQAYPQELVVVGVHSAKFENEQDSDNIREAVLRYEIHHPVVNDAEMRIWRAYGVRSWPTLVLIDPNGDAVWVGSGERKFEELQALVESALPYYRQLGVLVTSPLPIMLESSKETDTPLRFPGKVLADAAGNRLLIADSNHNRIVVTDLDGHLQSIIGTGRIGRTDGSYDKCSFDHPQGMAVVGNMLYVADTENHMLRKINLATKTVTTVAGTGEQGSGWPRSGLGSGPFVNQDSHVGVPSETAINSPWALWVHGETMYIAMAGPHQIWRMTLDERTIGPYAGNGREDIVDGALLPPMPYSAGYSSFAQPSGLASDGQWLFVADSEGSAIRAVPYDPTAQVETIVGVRGSLFDFGDVDGPSERVRLQHPLGIAYAGGKLYVADTYNNKIKVIDAKRISCVTLAGSGEPGLADATAGKEAQFNEPAGLAIAGTRLFVADTNNHAIRVIDLAADASVSTLTIDGLTPPNETPNEEFASNPAPN